MLKNSNPMSDASIVENTLKEKIENKIKNINDFVEYKTRYLNEKIENKTLSDKDIEENRIFLNSNIKSFLKFDYWKGEVDFMINGCKRILDLVEKSEKEWKNLSEKNLIACLGNEVYEIVWSVSFGENIKNKLIKEFLIAQFGDDCFKRQIYNEFLEKNISLDKMIKILNIVKQ